MSQIESYERPYNIVYGEYGGEPKLVPGEQGHDFPIWKARRMTVALLKAQIERTDDENEREALNDILREFGRATTGEVVWGMIRKWKNRLGKTRFIGFINKGQDYRKAGVNPDPPRPGKSFFRPSPHPAIKPPKRSVGVPPAKPVERQPSDAERIAAKMAKAARKAVEDHPDTTAT